MTNKTIEILLIDSRFEDHRLKDNKREKDLLPSIAEMGIREPILGVLKENKLILLDGFKRLRCARKLKMGLLPYDEIEQDEALGILKLLKISNNRSLHILEQAKLVDELKEVYGMKVTEIARSLERSSGWVSVRLGILTELGPYVEKQVFQGKFPAQNLLYTLRPFRRLNKIPLPEINEFVKAVSSKGLSNRDIEHLAQGYFKGGKETKEQIKQGKFSWCLQHLKEQNKETTADLPDVEKRTLLDLEIIQKYMGRLLCKLPLSQTPSASFKATASILIEGVLEKAPLFIEQIKKLVEGGRHDR